MKFGPMPVQDAVGALAAHTVRAGDLVVKKGTVVTKTDAARLRAAGVVTIMAARLETGDVGEDDAAERIAGRLGGAGVRIDPPFTGRCNLFAEQGGILIIDAARVDAVNRVDESVTVATLPPYKPVVAGEMVGTVKIIPYAVSGDVLERVLAGVAGPSGVLSVARYKRAKVAVVSTLLPGLKASVIDKTLRVLGHRLAPAGARIVADRRVSHDIDALTSELTALAELEPDLTVIFGASAIVDRRDVIPAAIEAAGGRVEHFGMPVDPGNLLLVGRLGDAPVLGAPGCARSPKENGFDWVLQRLLAGIEVTREDIVRLGVGGLLMEIVSRGQPRSGEPSASGLDG